MVGGLLVVASLVCVGSAVLRQRSRVASACFAAALAASAADAFGAGQACQDVAVAFGFAGAVTMVLDRLGRPLTMSLLDAVMGACAVGALAVTTGAELPATLAAIAVAATLGLARWRVTLALACALAALAALGELPVLAGVGFVAALQIREPDAGPASEFSPVVLVAILAYAATALTLLVVGQFVSLPPVAATLATVTVLTGMARAGLTVV